MSSHLLTTTSNTLPPLLRLPAELHLAIISFLPDLEDAKDEDDLALLQLRRTSHYFRDLVPPPTYNNLLFLEVALFRNSAYACQFCLRLRPKAKFAASMLHPRKGKKRRAQLFCADCGFDTTVVGKSQRYCPGTRAVVDGVDWIWCKDCKVVKKHEEADSKCVGLCKACYTFLGCRCRPKCGKPPSCKTPPYESALIPPRNMVPEASSGHISFFTTYRGSGGDDFWEDQYEMWQEDDDDWRSP